MVRHLDHVRVMLHDDDRVALVAQLLQQLIQAVHVARVQADARLVEDVHHVHQAAAQVLDHLDALRFAAGQRIGLAVQAEIFEADIHQVLQPFDQRLHDRRGDRVLDRSHKLDQLVISMAASSAMLRPLILQLSAAWLRRAPLHREHGPIVM